MKEFTITLTKADAWELLGCIEVSYSEGVCFYDTRFKEELSPHTNSSVLEAKLKTILYGNPEGIYNATPIKESST